MAGDGCRSKPQPVTFDRDIGVQQAFARLATAVLDDLWPASRRSCAARRWRASIRCASASVAYAPAGAVRRVAPRTPPTRSRPLARHGEVAAFPGLLGGGGARRRWRRCDRRGHHPRSATLAGAPTFGVLMHFIHRDEFLRRPALASSHRTSVVNAGDVDDRANARWLRHWCLSFRRRPSPEPS